MSRTTADHALDAGAKAGTGQPDTDSGAAADAAPHFWAPLRAIPQLAAGDVCVCQIALGDWAPHLDRLGAVLSAAERERAARFVFPAHRQRYTTVHGVLRYLLGRLVGREPAALEFAPQERGKPCLTGGPREALDLRFNLSDSGAVALIALALGREVGVDVERVRPVDHLELARRFFAPDEVQELEAVSATARVRAFFSCWTRKEAYVKAIGTGLGTPLDSFSVAVRPDAPVGLRRVGGSSGDGWTLADLAAGTEYCAALVTEGPLTSLCKGVLLPSLLW